SKEILQNFFAILSGGTSAVRLLLAWGCRLIIPPAALRCRPRSPCRPTQRSPVMDRLATLPLSRAAVAAWLLASGIGLAVTAPVRAADSEVRTFAVSVEGTKSGDYKMTIATRDDGTVVMSGQAEVNVKVLLVTAYGYAYNGVEVWKDGRLQRFDS